ncbi:MAG TPA: hypothetical protein VEL73_00325 [Mycobacteriales bacterium]|nr:hypothetical protein [Mycobacteriales bacterium]
MRVRSGVFAAWASAWLAGEAAYDDVVARVTGDDEPHRVIGAPLGLRGGDRSACRTDHDVVSVAPASLARQPGAGLASEVPLGWVLPVLRARSPDGVRAVLPVPGDPRGLPGPGQFTAAALAAGEAVLGRGIGLVPQVTEHGSELGSRTTCVLWTAYEVGEPAPDPITVAEAEHELTGATRDAASALTALDVASWRPEVADQLARVRRGVTPDLPPGHDGRAVRLLAQADRLAAVLDLARADAPGSSVTGAEARAREDALRPLGSALRRARVAAYNAVPSRHR